MKRYLSGVCVAMMIAVLLVIGCNKDSGSDSSILGLLAGGEKKLELTNFQAASLVLGQPNFTIRTVNTAAANTLSSENYSQPAVIKGKLYLPDCVWGRIMVYNTFPTSNNKDADAVLGQEDFTSHSANRGILPDQYTTLRSPETVSSDGTRFLIQDYDNHRILLYNAIPQTYNAAASVVVGQAAFTTVAAGTTESTLGGAEHATFAAGKLIIADSANNRVLIYNSIPTTNGASADIVLGQYDFTHVTRNDLNHDNVDDGAPTDRTMYNPVCVWSNGTMLIVSEFHNNRILIWNTFPTVNFQPADVVVGQASMTVNGSGGGANGLNRPYFLSVYAGKLFVADSQNHRVLIYNVIPTANGASADIVLGQYDFDHVVENDDDHSGVADANPSARTLCYPVGVFATDGKLIVADMGNIRYLVFK
jgi:hypothetical protein